MSDESPSHQSNLLTKSLRILKLSRPAPGPLPVPEPQPAPEVAEASRAAATSSSPGIRRSQSAQALSQSISVQPRRSESTDGASSRRGDGHAAEALQALVEANTLANSSAKTPPQRKSISGGDTALTQSERERGSSGSVRGGQSPGGGVDPKLVAVAGPAAGLASITRERIQSRNSGESPQAESSNEKKPSSRSESQHYHHQHHHHHRPSASRPSVTAKNKDCVLS